VTEPGDDRSPLAAALAWSSTIVTISLEMVIPGLIGYWIDQRLGTQVVFVLLGFAVGMVLFVWQLMRLTAGRKGHDQPTDHPRKPGS
jgi:hypothetical protein